jgi:hypothetical protein
MAQDIGLLLRGLGAAVSNQVPQFRQQMAQEQQDRMRQQEYEAQQAQRAQQGRMQNVEMMQARQQATAQDLDAGLKMAARGDWESIIALGEDRMRIDQQLGGSLENDMTPMFVNMARRAAAGDAMAGSMLTSQLAQGVSAMYDRGLLQRPEVVAPKPISASNIQMTADGPMVPMQQADGSIKMVPAPFTPAAQPEEVPKLFQESGELRREFSSIPVVRDFAQQSTAMGRIQASAEEPSAAGDMALVFNFMKVLDPGSTVREGEYANAQNAGGIDDKIISTYNRMVDGEILTAPQRADFLNRATRLYKSAEGGFMRTYNQYKNIANRRGLPIDDVLIDYRLETIQPSSQTRRDQSTSGAEQSINWADLPER